MMAMQSTLICGFSEKENYLIKHFWISKLITKTRYLSFTQDKQMKNKVYRNLHPCNTCIVAVMLKMFRHEAVICILEKMKDVICTKCVWNNTVERTIRKYYTLACCSFPNSQQPNICKYVKVIRWFPGEQSYVERFGSENKCILQ